MNEDINFDINTSVDDFKHYYKLETSSPFCGTDETEIIASNSEYKIDEDGIREDLFNSYGYLINGWGQEEPTEEEYEDFIAECTVNLEEISEKEFIELLDDGYHYSVYRD